MDRGYLGFASRSSLLLQSLRDLARWPAASFFICDAHLLEDIVDGLNRTKQSEPLANLLKGEIGLLFDKLSQALAMTSSNLGLAAAVLILGPISPNSRRCLRSFLTNSTDTQNR